MEDAAGHVEQRARDQTLKPLFVARRRFDPGRAEEWSRYIEWSGLEHLREVVSLDQLLCPTLPAELAAADWEHNVHADYLTSYFHSLDYLKQRVAGEADVNLLMVLRNPEPAHLRLADTGFEFLGFDVLDVHGDVSALTNCGGFEEVFDKAELSDRGLLPDWTRASQIRSELGRLYPGQSHTECDIWAIWRMTSQ